MLSRFIHVVARISALSYLWPNNILLYGYTIFCLSIYQLTAISVVSFVAITNNAANIQVQVLCGHIILFLLGIYLRVELLGHMVTLHLMI